VKLIHKLEPLWWILFGAGGFTACFFLPALIIGVLIMAPLGQIGQGLVYWRAHQLAAHPLGRIFLVSVISLVLWHCAHHMRHFALDVFGHKAAPVAAFTSYGLALAGTIAAFVLVSAL
jgi:fumarate reductase subunit D